MRFLIDECLSTDLVNVARHTGHEAHHVAHVGKAGWKDWNVARHAANGDFILVTNNADDFRKIYATLRLHAGLIILLPNVNRKVQSKLFAVAISQLTLRGEPINQVVEVDLDQEEAIVVIFDFPPLG